MDLCAVTRIVATIVEDPISDQNIVTQRASATLLSPTSHPNYPTLLTIQLLLNLRNLLKTKSVNANYCDHVGDHISLKRPRNTQENFTSSSFLRTLCTFLALQSMYILLNYFGWTGYTSSDPRYNPRYHAFAKQPRGGKERKSSVSSCDEGAIVIVIPPEAREDPEMLYERISSAFEDMSEDEKMFLSPKEEDQADKFYQKIEAASKRAFDNQHAVGGVALGEAKDGFLMERLDIESCKAVEDSTATRTEKEVIGNDPSQANSIKRDSNSDAPNLRRAATVKKQSAPVYKLWFGH
eukprot:TRINITY_DN2170_c0_g1_i1.p1 TRINITY_DN2170_c0_g1~~TRINITY_DN2170_c0_g1_i1.p1  ORF type:complete len:295 (-),score=65.86 TRINITY_DN2170_c0_g1_i1:208-1092(-)